VRNQWPGSGGTPTPTELDDLSTASERLHARLSDCKRTLGNAGFEWYPYDSLSNVEHIRRLFEGRHESVLQAALSKGVLDVGCGDGEMSFLFESLGCSVTAHRQPCNPPQWDARSVDFERALGVFD
jgi:hypothetical protein